MKYDKQYYFQITKAIGFFLLMILSGLLTVLSALMLVFIIGMGDTIIFPWGAEFSLSTIGKVVTFILFGILAVLFLFCTAYLLYKTMTEFRFRKLYVPLGGEPLRMPKRMKPKDDFLL